MRSSAAMSGSPTSLQGIRVLDFSHALAGPSCTLLLSDFGASVYKLESPSGGDMGRGWGPPFAGDQFSFFLGLNRGKYGSSIDLRNGMISAISSNYMSYLGSNRVPGPLGSAFPIVVPYRVYEARDSFRFTRSARLSGVFLRCKTRFFGAWPGMRRCRRRPWGRFDGPVISAVRYTPEARG